MSINLAAQRVMVRSKQVHPFMLKYKFHLTPQKISKEGFFWHSLTFCARQNVDENPFTTRLNVSLSFPIKKKMLAYQNNNHLGKNQNKLKHQDKLDLKLKMTLSENHCV